MTYRRFYIHNDQIQANQAVISGSEAHHMAVVLRLLTGDIVTLITSTSAVWEAHIETISTQEVRLKLIQQTPGTASSTSIIVAQALLKARKMDVLVRQLTELGISGFAPYFSSRSIPTPQPVKMKARLDRWERISREAAKQCGSTRLPEVYPATNFQSLLTLAKPADLKIIFWESKAGDAVKPVGLESGATPANIFLVLGPEGGFTLDEIALAKENGFKTAGLGPRILRAETAALAATTLAQYWWGDWGHSVSRQ